MRPLLMICGAVVVASVAAPQLLTRHAGTIAEAIPASRDGAMAVASRPSAPEGRQAEIRAARDGHFYVEAEVNMRPVRLMVDTGASVVALRQSDAAAAGMRPRPAEFEHPVATANGTTYAAAAQIDSVVVDGIEVSGVRALVLPDDQLSVSLLGASFLNRLGRFEVRDGTLVLEN